MYGWCLRTPVSGVRPLKSYPRNLQDVTGRYPGRYPVGDGGDSVPPGTAHTISILWPCRVRAPARSSRRSKIVQSQRLTHTAPKSQPIYGSRPCCMQQHRQACLRRLATPCATRSAAATYSIKPSMAIRRARAPASADNATRCTEHGTDTRQACVRRAVPEFVASCRPERSSARAYMHPLRHRHPRPHARDL